MAEDDRNTEPSLEDLEQRLRLARDTVERQSGGSSPGSAPPPALVGMAMRVGVELVVGVGVGALVGYGLDRWLDTSPWMMIVFFVLGAAAGMLNAYRSVAGLGMAVGYTPAIEPDKRKDASQDGRGDG
ncbi:MAG: phosphoribosylaminoimidazolecarboxamide formyltransferase [Rhodospirillaceae bacterium]|nr:phosphoribosylaminoimidazolecarboxamide formyltransferase [Rhodospirillaceae bacterium]